LHNVDYFLNYENFIAQLACSRPVMIIPQILSEEIHHDGKEFFSLF